MPNLGQTPDLRGLAAATDWSVSFNTMLASEIALQSNALGINIYEADMFALTEDIRLNPGDYGLVNSTDPVFPDLALDPATTAYWDGVHPTTAVHQIFAEEAFNSIPEPSMGILVVVAAGLLAGRRRR